MNIGENYRLRFSDEGYSIDETLKERGNRYGNNYSELCETVNNFMELARPHLKEAEPIFEETLHMVFQKIARLLHGDKYYLDNLVDIQGYIKLLHDEIIKNGYSS